MGTTEQNTATSETAATAAPKAQSEACPVKNKWVRRLGAAGFLFFLIKGLLWLTVPAAIAVWRTWFAD